MEYKKRMNKLTIVTLALSVLSFFLSSPVKNGFCGDTDTDCGALLGDSIGTPVFFFATSIFILSLILRWPSESVFHSWLRFAKYYLPIAALLIILSPVSDSSIFGFDKEFMSWLLSGTFFIVSLILIIYKQIKARF